jgi:hypothetical protein
MYEASEMDESLRVEVSHDFPFSVNLSQVWTEFLKVRMRRRKEKEKKRKKPQGNRCMPLVGIERTTLPNSIRFSP